MQFGSVHAKLVAQCSFRRGGSGHPECARDASGVGDVLVALGLIQRLFTESLVRTQETVDFGNVYPPQQVRVVGRIGPTVGCSSPYPSVNCANAGHGFLGGTRRAEGCRGEKVGRALKAAPRVVSVVGVGCDARHGKRVHRLQEQCAKPTDEHRCITVDANDRTVGGEPPGALFVHQAQHAGVAVGAGDTGTDRITNGRAEAGQLRIDLWGDFQLHQDPIVPAYASFMPSPAEEKLLSTRWMLKAAVIFWGGFLLMVATRHSFHRLTNLLLLLLVSIFLSLAIEPGVNKLESRGWRRGRATITILLSVIVGAIALMSLFATLVATQLVDLLRNSEKYVNETVDFINRNFNANIDPQQVNSSITDPNGPVQRFIDSQQDKVVSVSVQALSVLLQIFSVLLFTFYFVADGPKWRRIICSRLAPERQVRVLEAWEIAVSKTGGYLYSRALLALVSSFFHWIAFQAIGTPAPIAMAIWVGLVSQFMPVVGTYVAGVLPLVLSFIEEPSSAIFVIGFIIVYQQIENYLVSPRITARTMDLHPALAFGSAIAGAALLGPIGALLALPGAAMVQALASERGVRHDVIDSPLTTPQPAREKKQRRRKAAD